MEGKVLATLCAEKADGPFYPPNMANMISLKGLFFQGFEKIPRQANTCLLTENRPRYITLQNSRYVFALVLLYRSMARNMRKESTK